MVIRVRYNTGTYDYVSPDFLDDLIRDNKITQFFRSGAWTTIGVDPVRSMDPAVYTGPERRGVANIKTFGLSLARPLFKKGLYALLIGLTLIASTLVGTVLSAMLCPSVELEDPFSQAEIDAYSTPSTH